MRRIIVMGGALLSVAALALVVVAGGGAPGRPEVEKVQPQTTQDTVVAGKNTLAALERFAVGQQAQAELTRQKLEALEQRLQALEAAQAEENAAEVAKAPDSEPGAPTVLSEDDLGDWMLDRLRRHNRNSDWTTKAKGQVQQRLSELPGVEVEAVDCGDRFGRVTFFRNDGVRPDVVPLLGLPPFDNESFTAQHEDGSVSIYFTAPGVRVEELRAEAQPAAG
jgi:BMFP domain-containing protein YqiC